MARRNQKYCEWCMTKIKDDEVVCEKHLEDWKEHEEFMTPNRLRAAPAKVLVEAAKAARAELDAQVRAAEATLRDLKHQQIDHDDEISAQLARIMGINTVDLGSWKCEHSPTGKCFYDADKDHCNDFCLMCGGPDERK